MSWLVHSPKLKKSFVADAYGVNRRLVMHNDYVVVGPAGDPDKNQGMKQGNRKPLKKDRQAAGSLFLSRG